MCHFFDHRNLFEQTKTNQREHCKKMIEQLYIDRNYYIKP